MPKRSRAENQAYYEREVLLSRKIYEFKQGFYNLTYPLTFSEYHKMDILRKEIKCLLDFQGEEVWYRSSTRKQVYFDQLNCFKTFYPKWKSVTYGIYLKLYHISHDEIEYVDVNT